MLSCWLSAVFWSDNIKFQRLDGILCSENMDKSRCWGFDTWVTQGITKECSCFLTILFGSLDCVMSCYTCLQGKGSKRRVWCARTPLFGEAGYVGRTFHFCILEPWLTSEIGPNYLFYTYLHPPRDVQILGPSSKKGLGTLGSTFMSQGLNLIFLMETDFGICKPRFHRESFLLVESSMLLTGFFYIYIYVRSIGAVGPWLSLPTSHSYSDQWLRQHGLPSVSKTKPYMVFLKSIISKAEHASNHTLLIFGNIYRIMRHRRYEGLIHYWGWISKSYMTQVFSGNKE